MATIMGAQNKDPAVVGSSIALLQERFKQLQRLKEMREKMREERRQLLNLLPDQASDGYDEPSKTIRMSFSPPDHQAPFQDPLALGLNSHAHHMPHFETTKPQQFPSASRGTRSFYERPDVDTSLRL